MTSLSIVVPVYYSSKFIHELINEIEKLRISNGWDLELILVDDGSKDNSFEVIKNLSLIFPYIKAARLSRNFGHQLAVRTGLKIAQKEFVAIIDDDLQDPPHLIEDFIEILKKNNDVVYGIRKKRKENIYKRISYKLFYKVLSSVSHIDIQIDSGDFCVMKLYVVKEILKMEEQNPFLRGMRSWVGFKQVGFEYERDSRVDGKSGYTLRKLLKIALDGIFSFSNLPIRLITLLGFAGLFFALVYTINVLIHFFSDGIEVKGYTSLVILLSFFSSLILICLGIIGEYIIRIYDETRSRPHSVVSEYLNIFE